MRAAIAMWGNSLALRLPRRLAADADLRAGTPVELVLREGSLVVTAAKRKYRLEELLARVPGREQEVDFGAPVGEEI
jgi:antitoxin MazE